MTTPNKEERIFERPVAWLLGKQLLGGLKGILLYTAYGAKLDPRDWMTAEEVSFESTEASSQKEFWFDYLSDSGDGTRAMYSIAYLAMSTLWIKPDTASKNLPTSLTANSDRSVTTIKADDLAQLPRGEFLFFGGDTAYHAAEYMTLVNRVQRPFNYAYEDLRDRKLISDDDPRRSLFGIPGNHDYYDQIDGFRRQFRKPVRREGPLPPKVSSGHDAQLTLPGFKRVQETSYVALKLPFGWWMWGLDTESASDRTNLNLDRRQESFFRSLSMQGGKFKRPDKLILATCSPSTVFGHLADAEDPKVSKAMEALALGTPFLPGEGESVLSGTGDAKLDPGQCRLDLSGDVHHYARYWGPVAPAGSAIRKRNTLSETASGQSYASVVSGAGGAFHHPTATYDNQIHEQVLYPPEQASNVEVSKSLLKFWNVVTGGYVWLAGFILAFTIFFGMTVPRSSRQFIDNIRIVRFLQIKPRTEQIMPTIAQTGGQVCKSVNPFSLWTMVGVADKDWEPAQGCTAQTPMYLFADERHWPWDLKMGQIFIWLSVIAICAIFYFSLFTKKIFDDSASAFDTKNNPDRKLIPIILGTAIIMVIGLFSVQPYYGYITPFVSSLLVLFSLFTSLTAIAVNVRYGEYQFKKSFVPQTTKGWSAKFISAVDFVIPWLLWLIAVIVTACGLWFFGRNNLPSYLVSDITFIVVLLLGIIGILALPFAAGADLLCGSPGPVKFFGKFLIGAWHLVLQLLVPYLLIRNGNYVTWAMAALLLFAPILAQPLLKRSSRLGLSLAWLLYGALMLSLPWITRSFADPVFANTDGWMKLLPTTIAGITGAIVCCLLTGWYFAVCFVFNGHNNEVGGTARIEQFKEFIRFRLTPEGLTGYVIAVDDVSKIGEKDDKGHYFDGSDLKVKLIDVFHLVPKE